jgi:hypothetical protein
MSACMFLPKTVSLPLSQTHCIAYHLTQYMQPYDFRLAHHMVLRLGT